MNQTVYYREILIALLLICSVAEAKLIKPSMNGESKEILIINQKEGCIISIKSNGIKYETWRLEIRIYFSISCTQSKKHRVFHTPFYHFELKRYHQV